MKFLKSKLLLTGFLCATFGGVSAQDEAEETPKTFELSGTVDTYFRYNFSEDQGQAPATSFANLPGFSLGMANLIASMKPKNRVLSLILFLGLKEMKQYSTQPMDLIPL